MKIFCIYIIMFCVWSIPATYAEVYKWTDENGRVHYSDRPNNKQATTVDIKPSPVKNLPEAADWQTIQRRQQKFLRYLEEERQSRQDDKNKLAEQTAERKKRCEDASNYYKQLQATPLWYRKDEDGNKVFLSSEEKDQEIARAKGYADKFCGN